MFVSSHIPVTLKLILAKLVVVGERIRLRVTFAELLSLNK
jgi:hypothetical protein